MSNDNAALRAKVEVLEQLVRVLFFERAWRIGQSPDDVMQFSEWMKEWFEQDTTSSVDIAHATAMVDNFFTPLAADLRENPKGKG